MGSRLRVHSETLTRWCNASNISGTGCSIGDINLGVQSNQQWKRKGFSKQLNFGNLQFTLLLQVTQDRKIDVTEALPRAGDVGGIKLLQDITPTYLNTLHKVEVETSVPEIYQRPVAVIQDRTLQQVSLDGGSLEGQLFGLLRRIWSVLLRGIDRILELIEISKGIVATAWIILEILTIPECTPNFLYQIMNGLL